MDRCKCGSFAINEHAHGRIKGKHSDLCDVCYWREEAKQARREGWEQAKREAQYISFAYACHKGIAAMTYKEKCCEQTGPDNP